MKFLEMPRKDRKNLLKLAKQVSENNLEYDELKAQGKINNAASRSEGME